MCVLILATMRITHFHPRPPHPKCQPFPPCPTFPRCTKQTSFVLVDKENMTDVTHITLYREMGIAWLQIQPRS